MTRSVGRATVLKGATILALLATSVACLGSTDPTPAVEAGQGGFSILDGLRASLVEAHDRGDADAVASLFAETALLEIPTGEDFRGRAEIRSHYEALFSKFNIDLELVAESSRIEDAQTTFENGTFSLELRPRDAGAASSADGSYTLEGTLGTGGVEITLLRFVRGLSGASHKLSPRDGSARTAFHLDSLGPSASTRTLFDTPQQHFVRPIVGTVDRPGDRLPTLWLDATMPS